MRLIFIAAASSSLLLAGGCATVRGVTSDPVIVQASPQSITYRAAEGLRDEARKGAERHCEKQGRKAQLETVVPGEDTERAFTYLCV